MNARQNTGLLTVGLGGFGNVGQTLAAQLPALPMCQLSAVSARDLERAKSACQTLTPQPVVVAADELPTHADVIIECATYESFRTIVEPALRAGKQVIAVSVGALAENLDLIDLATQTGACLQVANGAMPGLDIIRCAAEGEIHSLCLTSHIRPESLAHEPYVLAQGLDLSTPATLTQPVPVFSGSARAAAAAFPRHFNVAVALSLAGVGLDRTQVEIFADASLPGARHTVSVDSDVITLSMTAQNRPSVNNNRTSRIVAPSILAALRALSSSLRLGS